MLPLDKQNDKFCPEHTWLRDICVVYGCSERTTPDSQTCAQKSHKELEEEHTARNKSHFAILHALARPRGAGAGDAGDVEELEETHEEPTEETANTDAHAARLRGRFRRNRTHNELVTLFACGVILTRVTNTGAEAIYSVKVGGAARRRCRQILTSRRQESVERFCMCGPKPTHIFYDNNCKLKYLVKDDQQWQDINLSVDVFHFNCKHSVKDVFCQTNCNPVMFPELLGENGKGWYFNSSIAEQTNVWLGGFHAIDREMLVDRFNFFLDQMII